MGMSLHWLESLHEVMELLVDCPLEKERLQPVVNTLGRLLGVASAFLLMKNSESGSSSLEVMASFPRVSEGETTNLSPSSVLDTGSLPPEWLENLSQGKTILHSRRSRTILGDWKSICLNPIIVQGELFGILAFGNFSKRSSKRVSLVGGLVAKVMQIWLGWLNERKRLEDFIDFMPNPTFVMHKDGRITAWNKATEEMTGWKADRVIGKGNYEHAIPFYGFRRPILSNLILYPDPYWESTYPEFHRVGNDLYTLSFCPALPDGGAFLTTKTSKIFDLTGRLWGSIHTVRDVTKERQMEKNLYRSESMYRAITDFAGIGMMLFQRQAVIYCNDQMARLLGASEGVATLDDLMKRLDKEHRDALRSNLERLFESRGESFRMELKGETDGRTRYYQCFAQAVEYEDEPTVYFIMDDITEQKELAEKARLNELRMYHEDRLTALGVMAAGIAHELNQPLNTIRVITDGLLFGKDEGWPLDSDELFEHLEMISRQVVRMSEVIKNIREFAREDRSQTDEEVDPNRAVEGVFSMIGRQLEAHGIKVEKKLDPFIPPVKGRLSRLEQVVMNLLVNARQALDECGHENREIWVRTFSEDGQVHIEVGDNATGISPSIFSKIFDPFFTTKEVGKGTGLGLTISQSIVAEMGGRIEAFNNEKGGATFVVRLPSCQSGREDLGLSKRIGIGDAESFAYR